MNELKNTSGTKNEYNYVVTIVLILILIIIRIAINNNSKQNVIIAWINFFSISYILWRIYFQVNLVLKKRRNISQVLNNQFKSFNRFALSTIIIMIVLMIVYSILLAFYIISYGSCINDIISLCALLFSIEDENIIDKLINHFRYS